MADGMFIALPLTGGAFLRFAAAAEHAADDRLAAAVALLRARQAPAAPDRRDAEK